MTDLDKFHHYIVYDVTYEELIKIFMKHDVPVFKYCPGIIPNDHYVAFRAPQQIKKKFDSMDPTKWILTTRTYEWYVNHGNKYNDVVIGHTKYDGDKKCVLL